MSEYILGVDIGTGSVKSIAMNRKGMLLAATQASYHFSDQQQAHEQDAAAILSAFTDCVSELVRKVDAPPVAISFSCAMHGLMVLDKEARALTPLLIWSDLRSADAARKLRKEAENLYLRTGTPLHAMTPLSKLIWMRDAWPEIFEKADKFVSWKEFIWNKLTGHFEIDFSIASATGLFNPDTRIWDREALSLAGIRAEQLSVPVPNSTQRPVLNHKLAAQLGLSEKTICCIGSSDGCLAPLGTGSLSAGMASLTIGTSAAVRISSPRMLTNSATMPFSYLLDDDNYICGYPMNNGGNVLDWVAEAFPLQGGIEAILKEMEQTPAGSEGLIFLPYIFAERAPVWDEHATGNYFGVRAAHAARHFRRAALEGLCYSLRQLTELLEQQSTAITSLHVSGGFTHSPFWLQLLADITGKAVETTDGDDASAMGAALLCARTLGWDTQVPKQKAPILPDPVTHAAHASNFSIFQQLYPSLKALMHSRYTSTY